jgi:nucleotide-binding universal stress UspA family protein
VYEKLIVGYNGTSQARDGLALGAVLAGAAGTSLLLACAVRRDFPIAPGSDRFVEAEEASARELLDDALATLPDGVEADTRVIRGRSPAQALHDLAAAEGAGLVALGSCHRGSVGRVLAGSTAERLLHGSPCAVAVAPRGYAERGPEAPRVIGVGFNGLPESQRALAHARELARLCGATLRLFAVHEADVLFGYADVPVGDHEEALTSERERLQNDLAAALASLPAAVRAQGSVLAGSAAEVLAAEAEKGVDLLVVGSRGYGPLRHVLMGGTSSTLMRSSPCPVLAVPRSAASAAASGAEAATAASA